MSAPFPKPFKDSNRLESPFKELSHETLLGERIHRQGRPTRTGTLHTMGCILIRQEDGLRHYYYRPSSMQPSAQYLPVRFV